MEKIDLMKGRRGVSAIATPCIRQSRPATGLPFFSLIGGGGLANPELAGGGGEKTSEPCASLIMMFKKI